MDRLTKSKEAALLEAERTVEVALVKASMVDDLQNKNQELMKQIEICQVTARSCMIFFLNILFVLAVVTEFCIYSFPACGIG